MNSKIFFKTRDWEMFVNRLLVIVTHYDLFCGCLNNKYGRKSDANDMLARKWLLVKIFAVKWNFWNETQKDTMKKCLWTVFHSLCYLSSTLPNRFTFISSAMKWCLVIVIFSVHFCARSHKTSNYRLMTCEYNEGNFNKSETFDRDVWKRIPKWAAKWSGVHFKWFSVFTLTPSAISLSTPVKLPKSTNRTKFVLFQL